MSAPYDEAARQAAAWEAVRDLAQAHGLDADADADGALRQDLYDTLLAYAQVEREALLAALVQEYAAVLAHADVWQEQGRVVTWRARLGAATVTLERVAQRLGITDLHERASAGAHTGSGPGQGAGRGLTMLTVPEHTPAQLALRRTMEQISEERWASGWYSGLERILWRCITEPGAGAMLTAEERDVLGWLMAEAGGWWHWPKGADDPQFVGRRAWQRLYQDGGPPGTA